jgi:hypothetical protein
MTLPGTLPLTRRCFFAAAGLSVAAGAAGAGESAAQTADLPKATVLNDAGTKTYFLVFRAAIRPTAESILTTYPEAAHREIDPETGLPLVDAWRQTTDTTWQTRTIAGAKSRSGGWDCRFSPLSIKEKYYV